MEHKSTYWLHATYTCRRFITGSSVTGLRLSIPFERDVFIFAFLASFLVRPGCRFLGPACGSCGRCVTPRSGTAVGHRCSRHPASLRAASHNATMLSKPDNQPCCAVSLCPFEPDPI